MLRQLGQLVLQTPKNFSAWLAIFLIKRKLRRRPYDVNLLVPLAHLYEIRGQLQRAVDTIERAQQAHPQSRALAQMRARIEGTARGTTKERT